MKKSSHNKIKNTIILFELLTRQVASDTLKGVEKSPALTIIKNHFKSNSALGKELVMYQTLVNESYKSKAKATSLMSTVVGLRKKLTNESLKKEKYELIREIKDECKEISLRTLISVSKVRASNKDWKDLATYMLTA